MEQEDRDLLIRLDERTAALDGRYEAIDRKLDQVIKQQRVQSDAHANLRVKVAGIAGAVALIVSAVMSWIGQAANTPPS